MGIFGKGKSISLIGEVFDAITEVKPSTKSISSRKSYISTTTTTMPDIGVGLRNGSILDTLEKIDTILTDVDTEGEKRGYERAAAEYDAAFERIENEYLTVKKLLEQNMDDKDAEASRLISKLQQLEEYRRKLEIRVREK